MLRALVKDSALYGGADFISKVIAFVAFPLIAAKLSPQAFGTLELVTTATALLGLAANCGLNNALQRYYWDTETRADERPTLVSSGLAALMVMLVAAMLVGSAAATVGQVFTQKWQLEINAVGIAAALLLMFGTQTGQYLLDVTRLHLAPWRFLGLSLLTRVLTAVAGVGVVVYLGYGLEGLLVAQAAVSLLALPVAGWAVSRDLTTRLNPASARKLLTFGYPFIYASLAFWLFASLDRWMLAAMSSVEEVGIYSVANRFASVVMFVSIAFGQAWSPLAIKIRTDHPNSYRNLYSRVLLALSCAMLALGGFVALFANELITWLMPSAYQGAAKPLAVLSLGIVLQSTLQVTAIGISLEKRTHLFGRISWAAAALNCLLNLAFIPAAGALGAAWATALSYLFLTGSYLYYTQRLHPLPLPVRRLAAWGLLWLVLALVSSNESMFANSVSSLITRLALLLACLAGCAALMPWRNSSHVHS